MINFEGKNVDEALPSTPVEILGMNDTAFAGAELAVTENENEAKKIAEQKTEETFSNLASLYKSFEIGKDIGEDLIYFLEDDYIHFQTMLDDMTWAVDNGYLLAADLNKIMAIEGIKDRHDGVTKSLGDFRPQFYQAVKVLHEKAGTREHDRKLKAQQNTVTTEVEKAQERLKKIEGGATEKDLLDEVNNVKKLLNDTHGIVVADDNSNQFWRYFQPLTGFVTNEDKVDIDTVKHIDNDLLQNDFENAEARLDEINDPKLREDVQKRIKGYDKIAQNKDLYDQYEKRIEQRTVRQKRELC